MKPWMHSYVEERNTGGGMKLGGGWNGKQLTSEQWEEYA